MPSPQYKIEILSKTGSFITPIQVLAPINAAGDTMSLTFRLSNWGQLKFRVATKDPLFTTVGDVLQPYNYHVRVKRAGSVIWQGVIIKNPTRNNRYVEVVAYSYLFLFSKVLIRHDASVTTGDGLDNYRTFNTGLMSDAVNSIVTQARDDVQGTNILSNLTIGTIENPNYPSGYSKPDGTALTGTWNFSSDLALQYDYRSSFYVIGSMALYTACDFELTKDLVFNYEQFLGNKNQTKTFTYGPFGNVLSYDAPLDGEAMANVLTGVASDYGNQLLHVEQSDQSAVALYGRVQDVSAYSDVKNINALKSRMNEELRLVSSPDSEIHLELNQRAPELGEYSIGDVITVDINDYVVKYRNQPRRIVGINIRISNTGMEHVTLITNKPKDGI